MAGWKFGSKQKEEEVNEDEEVEYVEEEVEVDEDDEDVEYVEEEVEVDEDEEETEEASPVATVTKAPAPAAKSSSAASDSKIKEVYIIRYLVILQLESQLEEERENVNLLQESWIL